MMHEIFYNNAPKCIRFFVKRNPVYNTRHSFHNFSVPKGQTNYKMRSSSYRGGGGEMLEYNYYTEAENHRE